MRKLITILLISIPVLALAQSIPPPNADSYVKKGTYSIFDPSRLSMNQSYSLSYYSGGGNSGSIGYYMNSLEYRFSSPLKIRVDLGYLHSPTGLFSRNSTVNNSGMFVPGISIDWKPTENFNFRLDYHHVPVDYYRGYGTNSFFQEDYR
ncbi:MAG: hypothetical protein V3W18_04860 [candidate division Zixibacteria bacterium]